MNAAVLYIEQVIRIVQSIRCKNVSLNSSSISGNLHDFAEQS